MAFTVDPHALVAYGRQLERAADDARQARRYLDSYADLRTGGDLINIARSGHVNAVTRIGEILDRLTTILECSRAELDTASRHYRVTDLKAAARADAVLPATADRCATPMEYAWAANLCEPVPFVDSREPAGHLTSVPEQDNPHNALGFMDALSLAHWVNEAFDAVFGFNPVEAVQKQFVGDWERLAQTGVAIANLAGATYDIAFNVQSGDIALNRAWDGNAADAAHRYFTDLANAVGQLREPLQEIARQYESTAHAVWSAAEAVGNIVKALVDVALVAGIAIAAGTATSATGIGALVGYGVAGLEVVEMIRLWGAATTTVQKIGILINAFVAVVESQLAQLDDVRAFPLPAGAGYDHPLVTR